MRETCFAFKWVRNRAVTFPNAVHKPFRVKSGYVGSSAGTDNHRFSFQKAAVRLLCILRGSAILKASSKAVLPELFSPTKTVLFSIGIDTSTRQRKFLIFISRSFIKAPPFIVLFKHAQLITKINLHSKEVEIEYAIMPPLMDMSH